MYNYKYLEILILIILNIVTREGKQSNRCLHEICHDSIIAVYNLSNGQLNCPPFQIILLLVQPISLYSTHTGVFYRYSQYHQHSYSRFLTGVLNTNSTPTGQEGGGRWVAMKWWEKFTINNQAASIVAILTSTYHTKQLNPWPNSPDSQLVNYSQLSACNLSTPEYLISLINKIQ